MYGFLIDQTYINLILLGFFLFIIMFLWRKITIIEGNYFILEKRVDMFKKSERDSLISKNIEKADIVMNEIFKDSTAKKAFCNNVNYTPEDTRAQKCSIDETIIVEDSIDLAKYINIMNSPNIPEDIKNKIEIIETPDNPSYHDENKTDTISLEKPNYNVINNYVDENVDENPKVSVVSEVNDFCNAKDMNENNNDNNDNNDIMNVIVSGGDNIDNDTVSISSDITFGSDHDKSITKKYKKMSVEKLREECMEKSLNSEGSKAALIARILEYNKKS
jgi:hypothetical protein